MIVYKVLRKWRGQLRSAIMTHPIALTYEMGKPIKPVFGKILAFADLALARKFISGYAGFIIYKAEASDIKSINKIMYPHVSLACLRKWWLNKQSKNTIDAPQGTVACSEITVLNEVAPCQ